MNIMKYLQKNVNINAISLILININQVIVTNIVKTIAKFAGVVS